MASYRFVVLCAYVRVAATSGGDLVLIRSRQQAAGDCCWLALLKIRWPHQLCLRLLPLTAKDARRLQRRRSRATAVVTGAGDL
jgi:hypothetical protein